MIVKNWNEEARKNNNNNKKKVKEKKCSRAFFFFFFKFFCSLYVFVVSSRAYNVEQIFSVSTKVKPEKNKESVIFAWSSFFLFVWFFFFLRITCNMKLKFATLIMIIQNRFAWWLMIISIYCCRCILSNEFNPPSHWINGKITNSVLCIINTLQSHSSWSQLLFGHKQGLTGTNSCL